MLRHPHLSNISARPVSVKTRNLWYKGSSKHFWKIELRDKLILVQNSLKPMHINGLPNVHKKCILWKIYAWIQSLFYIKINVSFNPLFHEFFNIHLCSKKNVVFVPGSRFRAATGLEVPRVVVVSSVSHNKSLSMGAEFMLISDLAGAP